MKAEKEEYKLGGSTRARLLLHEIMERERYVAKTAYYRVCKELRERNVNENDVLALYDKKKEEVSKEFVSIFSGIEDVLKHKKKK